LDTVYAYLRNWARNVKLNLDPDTTGLIHRFADNARGLLAVADSCGPEWGKLARDALMVFSDRERAEQPHFLIVKHGLAIFDALGLNQAGDVISTVQFNRELRLLISRTHDGRDIAVLAVWHILTRSRYPSKLRC
jgi:hypothetical protein